MSFSHEVLECSGNENRCEATVGSIDSKVYQQWLEMNLDWNIK
jgi:hypothetical protein